MKPSGHDAYRTLMMSPEWAQTVFSNNLIEYERVIDGFLADIDNKKDPTGYTYGLITIFGIYVNFHEKAKALEVLERLDQIEPPDGLDFAKTIAEKLFVELDDIELAERYITRALEIKHPNPDFHLVVISLALAISVKSNPHTERIQDLLDTLLDCIQNRRFYNRHLMQSMRILVPLGLVSWKGRFILEAMWAKLSVNVKFYPQKDRKTLKEIAELHILLPKLDVNKFLSELKEKTDTI